MAQLKLGAAGVTANEIDISGPLTQQPVGIPAGVIGTSKKGPAFVPITVGTLSDFQSKFGTVDSKHFGPIAVLEWLRNARAVSYLRVLGVGDGLERQGGAGVYPGSVTGAGFVVGEQQPSGTLGKLDKNEFANFGGDLGRTYFLGCYMSESLASTFFSDAGLQLAGENKAVPIVRGVLMAASGVLLRLSSSLVGAPDSSAPASNLTATMDSPQYLSGATFGTVTLMDNGVEKQDFVLLLNGHKGLDANSPNVVTASFDPSSNNYFGNVLNRDPLKLQEKGHYLYTHWDIHPAVAELTGVGILSGTHGADVSDVYSFYKGKVGVENSAFIITSSIARNTGTSTIPNYESFEDRFNYAKSPWVISQKFGGKPVNLFRLHALDAGANISNLYKISIENITPSNDPVNKYGSFTIRIRRWGDRDSTPTLISSGEAFVCDLNPTSPRYIAKMIGDINSYFDFDRDAEEQKLVIEGAYPSRSNYVRVEVSDEVANEFIDPTALPIGFRGAYHLVTSGTAVFPTLGNNISDTDTSPAGGSKDKEILRKVVQPPVPFRKKVTDGVIGSATESANVNFYWGTQFEQVDLITKPNSSVLVNKSIESFTKYFPGFATTQQNFVVGDNSGVADTAANGILDADRFNNNIFTLENIQVATGSSGAADTLKWHSASYVRNGNIAANDSNKTRAFQVSDLNETINRRYAKFTLFMQGGFDGVNIFDEDEARITNNAVSSDMVASNGRGLTEGPNVKAFVKAVDIMKNVTNLDIQLLAIPGIRHPIVTDYATVAVEERFDALYLMDVEQYKEEGTDAEYEVRHDCDIVSVVQTINSFRDRNIDNSFAAAYFPDILYAAPDRNNLYVPPSALVLGALSLNDAVGHPWFAPAGFARGALPQQALESRVRLKEEDLDGLYNDRLNPIVGFVGAPKSGTNPASGLVVWGQKTLQVASSALDRVNVRRLLIEIRRQVREIAQGILFEPNREATLARFSAAVTPRLQRIQALSGLERFRVIIDATTTSQTDVENNTVRGKIFVQPVKSIEFVSLDFVVANNLQQVQ
jgi:hypothetical protein